MFIDYQDKIEICPFCEEEIILNGCYNSLCPKAINYIDEEEEIEENWF